MNESENQEYKAQSSSGNSVFSTLRRELLNILTLNLLFIVTALPIVTLPAAITSMSRVTGLMVQDQNCYVWGDYIRTFKREFGKSLLGGLFFGGALLLLILAGFVYASIFGQSVMLSIIVAFDALLILMVVMASVYFWTMQAFVDLGVKKQIKNSIFLVFGCWKSTLPALVVVLVQFFFFFGLFPVGLGRTTVITDIWLFVVFLIMFSLNNLLINFAIWPAIYDRVISRKEEPRKPSATALHSKESLKWEEPEEELKSAGTDSLKWD